MSDLNFFMRLKLLSTIDVTIYELASIENFIKNGESEEHEIAECLEISGVNRGKILNAFSCLDEASKMNLLAAWKVVAQINQQPDRPTELCLTGLNPEGYDARVYDTFIMFKKLITMAKEQINILGYHFTDGNQELIELLNKRLVEDNININVLTDHIMNKISDFNHNYLRLWIKDTNLKFRLYSYEHPDVTELMHIKCMVIDGMRTYVGSSNFSKGGILKNIELGVVINDGPLSNSINNIFNVIIRGDVKYVEKIDYKKLKSLGII